MFDVVRKDPCDSGTWRKQPLHWKKGQLVYPPLVSWPLQSQRRLHNLNTLTLYLGRRPPACPWLYPFMGGQVWLTPIQSRQTGSHESYPLEPNWILPPWSPCKWPYHTIQQWVKCNVSTSPRPLSWCPWPRHPCLWPCPNPQINLTPLHGLRSSEQMQCSLPEQWVTKLP